LGLGATALADGVIALQACYTSWQYFYLPPSVYDASMPGYYPVSRDRDPSRPGYHPPPFELARCARSG